MARLWPVLVIAAAALVLAVLLFGSDDTRDGSLEDDESYLEDAERSPELMASEAVRRRKEADAEAARRAEQARREAQPEKIDTRFLHGTVVSAVTGRPIAGAMLWAQEAGEPCPRLPAPDVAVSLSGVVHRHARRSTLSPSETRTANDGRFDWRVDADTARLNAYDVFVRAPGHVTGVLCRPAVGSGVTVRLQEALKLQVRVTDRHGRPVEGARIDLDPAPETPALPGHSGFAISDREGRCTVDGLLPGALAVKGDHPGYMPVEEGPVDPALQSQIELRLPPAMRFTFTLRSDDASAIENPTVLWRTDGTPPHEQLLLLGTMPNGPEDAPTSEVKSQVVRVPCDHRNVFVELKADGFAPWKAAPEPLPSEGGVKDMIAVLVRDISLSALRVRFEDPQGEAVSFATMKGVPAIRRLDPRDPGPVVVETSEFLTFPALPAGPYRIGVRCPDYAPIEQDVEVVTGEENEVTVRLRAAARLRVRFTSTERVTVHFRLRRDGSILPAFPVAEGAADGSITGLEPLEVRGEEGALFGGLDSGSATIEVSNPDLVAPPRTVQLREGETTEVEIEVRER